MKARFFIQVVTLAAVLALCGGPARAWEKGDDVCSDATLRGKYAFTISGETVTPNGIIVTDGVAMTTFDGAGHFTQVDFVLSQGMPVPGVTDSTGFHIDETGTYSVNPNCTGHAEIDFPAPSGVAQGQVIKLMMVIANHGRDTIVASLTPPGASGPVPTSVHSDGFKVGDVDGDKDAD